MLGGNIVSPTHLLLVLVVILLVFGTKKLPELGRGLGSAMREFKGGVTGTETREPARSLEASPPAPATAQEAMTTVGTSR
jgi:sec-independent protein translocase protein TatA